jgi:hypothetical protein
MMGNSSIEGSAMPNFEIKHSGAEAFAVLAFAFAGLALAACGNSSDGSSKSFAGTSPRAASTAGTATTTGTVAATGMGGSSAHGSGGKTSTGGTPKAEGGHASPLVTIIVRCLRKNGINLPAPDAAGNVNTTGIDMNSRKYRAAAANCERTFAEKGRK